MDIFFQSILENSATRNTTMISRLRNGLQAAFHLSRTVNFAIRSRKTVTITLYDDIVKGRHMFPFEKKKGNRPLV